MPKERTDKDIPLGFTLRSTLQTGGEIINRIVWSPDGEMLACAFRRGHVYIWDVAKKEILQTLLGTNILYSVAWSPDGKMLALGGKSSFFVWNIATGNIPIKPILAESTRSVAWSPDGKTLATGSEDGVLRLWDAASKEEVFSFEGHQESINGIAWSPDGSVFVSGSDDTTLRFWSIETKECIWESNEHTAAINMVIWSSDGRMVASASNDKTIQLWDVDKKQLAVILKSHTGPVVYATFSYDSRMVASKSLDGTVRLWLSNTGKLLETVNEQTLLYNRYTGISFHPTLSCLATLGEEDAVIRIWDIDSKFFLDLPTTPYRSAKVVLVGESGAGKTSLSLALTGQPYVPPEATHGRTVLSFDRQEYVIDNGLKEIRETLLWDLAGQRHYRLLHQLHLNKVVLALIVFDTYSDPDPLQHVFHWERMLRYAEHTQSSTEKGTIKKFLVAARVDWKGRVISSYKVNELIKELALDQYFITSAKKNDGIEPLVNAIRDNIPWEALPRVSPLRLFNQVKKYVNECKDRGEELLTVDKLYRGFIASLTEGSDEKELYENFVTCIDQLEEQDTIKRLHPDTFVLLKPQLLDYYASALIDTILFSEPDGLGSIFEEKVIEGDFPIPPENRLENKALEKILLSAMIKYLQQQEIIFREYSDDGTYLIFPSLMTQKLSESLDVGNASVVYCFEGPIPNIYATLAVRLTHSTFFTIQTIWKNAMSFTGVYDNPSGNTGICSMYLHMLGDSTGELTLSFDANVTIQTHMLFENFIYAHLSSHSLKGSVHREYIVACSNCGEVFTKRIITRRYARSASWIRCSVCDTITSLEVRTETADLVDQQLISDANRFADNKRDSEIYLTDLLSQSQAKKIQEKFDVYLCYDPRDEEHVRRKNQELMRKGIAPWFDVVDLISGQLKQPQREHQIKHYKAAAVFIGTEIGTQQQLEIEALRSKYVEQGCPVIPVFLESAPDKLELPEFLEAIQPVDFRPPLSSSTQVVVSPQKDNQNPLQGETQEVFVIDQKWYQAQNPLDVLVEAIKNSRCYFDE